jgi:MoxR-like ATPase
MRVDLHGLLSCSMVSSAHDCIRAYLWSIHEPVWQAWVGDLTLNGIGSQTYFGWVQLLEKHFGAVSFQSDLDLLCRYKKSQDFVLTGSRVKHASAVAGAVLCNLPVFLEGDAAVGKTKLIIALGQTWEGGPLRLERINNTDSTTIQDYLGSYIPIGKSFEYREGALTRALKNGDWFLADDFNLANSSVMALMFPLLEGRRELELPGKREMLTAHPNFRFFATRNPGSYANRHALPTSLRNRFLEVQVEDFPEEELKQIILERTSAVKVPPAVAKSMAKIYNKLREPQSAAETKITMREIVKWIHRAGTLLKHSVYATPGQFVDTKFWMSAGLSLLQPRLPKQHEKETRRLFEAGPFSSYSEITEVSTNTIRFYDGDVSFLLEGIDFTKVRSLA